MDSTSSQPVSKALSARAAEAFALTTAEVEALWGECGVSSWGLTRFEFESIVQEIGVAQNFGVPAGAVASAEQRSSFFAGLKLGDLVLAKACAAGSERAWEHFLKIYSAPLTRAAIAIAGNASIGRDIADAFYAELYGLKLQDGERKCPLASYRGRGSLAGWLRTALAQRYVDHYRKTKREEPLPETEDGESFDIPGSEHVVPAPVAGLAAAVTGALQTLGAEERFVLASYYLDERTLAQIGGVLRVHEATVHRRLRRATDHVRKQLLRNLEDAGLSRRAAEEALGTDPRDVDLKMDLKKMLQNSASQTFPEQGATQQNLAEKLAGTALSDGAEG